MRIVSLLARYGTEQYAGAIHDLDGLFARQLPDTEHDVVILDTALPKDHEERLDGDQVLLGADNMFWEFSAWDRGISYLGSRIDRYDLVHLATSAFRMLYTRYLDRITTEALTLIVGRAAAVGHIDYYNEPVLLYGRSSQAWIRSSCLFIPPSELRLLGSLISVTDPVVLFSGNPDAPFRTDAPISATYRKYILDWLTGAGTGQGVDWHSRFELSVETLKRFEAKTVAILNEHMLGVRLRSQGCAMVDATWLAARRAQLGPTEPLCAIPSWRWQITARDTDPAPRSLIEREAVPLQYR